MPVTAGFIELTGTTGVTNLGSGGRDPQITALAGGGYVIAWAADGIDGSGEAVMIRVFDADGNALGNEVQVNQTTSGEQYAPTILARDDGGFDVFWFYETQGRYIRSFDETGTPTSNEIDLGAGFTPVLTALSTGQFMEVVTTISFNGQSLTSNVRINLLDASYASTGTSLTINQRALPDGVVSLAITTLDNGNVVALWSDNSSGSGSGTFGRILSPQGTAVSDEFQVDIYDLGRQIEPRATALTGGGFVVTWKSGYGQDGSDWGQFAQIFYNDGTKNGTEFQVNTLTDGIQYQGTPVALADGGFVVVYLTSPYELDTDSAVLAQQFDATGAKVGDAVLVATVDMTNGNQFYTEPYAIALEGGGFAVTWWGGNTPDMIYTKVFTTALTGTALADTINGSNAREMIDGDAGDDTITAGGGDDTVIGGAGADSIDGGAGGDLITSETATIGTAVGDVINGTALADVILAGAGNDTVIGAEGNDTIMGQGGADVFMFDDGFGSDIILDFENDTDLFDMDLIVGVESFSDIMVTQAANGTTLSLTTGATDSLLLFGVQSTDIDASDFIFV